MKQKRQRVGDLEIIQDIVFQRRSWMVERCVWALGATVLVLALGGLFGGGTLTRTDGDSNAPLHAEYERFARLDAPTSLFVHVRPAREKTVTMKLSHSFLSQVHLEEILPAPARSETAPDGITFTFNIHPDQGDVPFMFQFRPMKPGGLTGVVVIHDVGELRFRQFVFP